MTPSTSTPDPALALLDEERANFLAQVARVPASRRAERPAPERWSVAEIVEHVARIDRGVAKLFAVRGAQPLTASAEEVAAAQLTAEKVARVRNRAERIEAPEQVRPTGAFSPEAALAELAEARAALKAAYLATDPAVLDGAVHPHRIVGPLTLRSWLALAAHHDARHAQQIAEIAEAP